MFDIGLGELLILGVLALVVFGPDQLPKAAASAGRWVRQLREMATAARKEIGDNAGLDSLTSDLQSLRDLHPKRLIASALDDPKPAVAGNQSPVGEAGGHARGTEGVGGGPAQPRTPIPPPRADPKPTGEAGYDPDAT